MLENFLDRVSGEHTEAAADEPTEKQVLLSNWKNKEGDTQALFRPLSPSSDQQLFSLLLRSAPEQSLGQQP